MNNKKLTQEKYSLSNPPLNNLQSKLTLRYLPYFGGKGGTKLGSWIFKNFDLSNITNYVEPFSGMFGIYFGEFSDFSTVDNIIYNDVEIQNCNVMSCAQMPGPFFHKIHNSMMVSGGVFYNNGLSNIQLFEYYKDLFKDYSKKKKVLPKVTLNNRNYEAAILYSFLRLSAMKSMHYHKIGPRNMYGNNWYKRYKILQPLCNKLSNHKFVSKAARLQINSDDFQIIMNKYNSGDSFIYLDPPYYDREKIYDHEDKGVFGKADHERLAKVINNSKARIALSYYYFDGIHDLYPRSKFRYEKKKSL